MEPSTSMPDRSRFFLRTLQRCPGAVAVIRGSDEYRAIQGRVTFHQTPSGVLVSAQLFGLPTTDDPCKAGVFAFHIHGGGSCSGDADDPFQNARTHYNPGACPHPGHTGDLPPLFENRGYAYAVFLTDRFSVEEIIGKTVILHRDPDDFTTQPAGNAGKKIACGEIVPNQERRSPRC